MESKKCMRFITNFKSKFETLYKLSSYLFMRLLAISSTYLLSFLTIKWYGADVYGQYVVLLGIFLQLSIFGKFGYDLSLTRFLSSQSTNFIPLSLVKRVFNNILFILGMLLIAFISLYIIDADIFIDYSFSYSIFFLALFSFFSLSMFISGGLRGLGKVSEFALINITSRPMLTLIIVCLFYLYSPSETNIFYAHSLAIITVLILSLILARKNQITIERTKTKIPEFIQYNRLLFFSTMIYVVLTTGDRVLLGILSDPEVVAAYDISIKIAMLMIIVMEALNTYFSPIFSKLQNNIPDLKVEVKKSTQFTVGLSLLAFIVVGISGNFLLGIYGFEDPLVYYSVMIVSLCFFISSFFGQALSIIQMTGHIKGFILKMLVAVLSSFALAVIMVPKYGIIGMSICFGMGYISVMLLAAIHLKKKLNINSFLDI